MVSETPTVPLLPPTPMTPRATEQVSTSPTDLPRWSLTYTPSRIPESCLVPARIHWCPVALHSAPKISWNQVCAARFPFSCIPLAKVSLTIDSATVLAPISTSCSPKMAMSAAFAPASTHLGRALLIPPRSIWFTFHVPAKTVSWLVVRNSVDLERIRAALSSLHSTGVLWCQPLRQPSAQSV